MAVAIYGLFCPLAGVIRYIGKSSDPERRFKAHLGRCSERKTHKDRWIAKLLKAGLKPELVILEILSDDEDWAAAEVAAIGAARKAGFPLTNLTRGGEGAALTEEARAAKIIAMGKPETRGKMSASARARWSDPDRAQKGREANRTAEKRRRLSEAAKRRSTPEYRAMMAERTRAAWADREKRAQIEAGITPEVRAKVSAASKQFWASSENADICRANLRPMGRDMVEKAIEARKSPEHKVKMRKIWDSPEYRRKLSLALKASWERRKG